MDSVTRQLGASENPYVEIPKVQRKFIMAFILSYMALIMVSAFLDGSRIDEKILLVGSSIIFLGVVSFPLFFKFKVGGFLHPLVLSSAFVLVNLIIRKSDVLANGLDYHVALPGWSSKSLSGLVAYVNIVISCGFLAKYVGYYVFGSLTIRGFRFNKRPNSLFTPLLMMWLGLGFLALFLLINASGGIQYHLININRGSSKSFIGDTRFLGLCVSITQSTVLIPVLYAAFVKKGNRSLIFVILVLLSFVVVYLTSGRRSSILVPSYLACAIWIYKERSLPLIRILCLGILMFFFLSVGSVWRDANRRSSQINWNFLQGYTVTELAEISMRELSDRSGNSSAMYPIVVLVPDKVPFNYGRSYFENVYRFIPRSVWPEKPNGIGVTCAEVFFHRRGLGGIPPGAYGEAYWSFGITGVILVFFLFGMVLRFFGNIFVANPHAMGFVAIYLFTLVRLGPDQISFRVWIFAFVPTILFLIATNLVSVKGR